MPFPIPKRQDQVVLVAGRTLARVVPFPTPKTEHARVNATEVLGIPETKQPRSISTGKGTSSTRAELRSVELRLPAAEVGREAHPSDVSARHLLRELLNLATQKAFRRGVLRPTVFEDCLWLQASR